MWIRTYRGWQVYRFKKAGRIQYRVRKGKKEMTSINLGRLFNRIDRQEV